MHLTETCAQPAGDPAPGQPAVPNLITNVATTPASTADVAMTGPIHDGLEAAGLAPGEHAVDTGYTSADELAAAQHRGITLLGPLRADSSPQARAGGYTAEDFTIDWDHQHATCPQGRTSISWWDYTRHGGQEFIVARFSQPACHACPARAKCTTSRSGRTLYLRPRPIHDAVTAARAAQNTPSWKARYAIRAGAEATMRQATHTTGLRRARYLGLPKTELEHHAAATAINLIRLDAWWTGTPLHRDRTSHLQRLHLAPAA